MAKQNVPMKINLRRNQNSESKIYGKYFCEPDSNEALSTKGFARHLSEHGKLATYDMLVLVLQNVVSCMKELLTQGIPVKLDGLGTFRPTITNVKGGAESVEDALNKGADNLIEGVHISFIPEGVKGEKLTGRAFKQECVFNFAYVVTCKKKEINGKKLTYQEKIPISSWAIANHEGGENGSTDSGNNGSQNSGSGSQNSGGSQNQNEPESVQAPEISGTTPFSESTQVTIQGPQGAEIRYTTNGNAPTAESTLYSEPFTLTDSATVKAIAILDGNSSEVASKAFNKSSSSGGAGFDNGN